MNSTFRMVIMILLGGFLLPTFLAACGPTSSAEEGTTAGNSDTSEAPASDVITEESTSSTAPAPHPLDGKKVIFIGNSYVFYGNAVVRDDSSVTSQQRRTGDRGYFYQLCKANGIDVSVTDWCFSGHGLADMFGRACEQSSCTPAGVRHYEDLKDPYYDYVFASPGSGTRQEATLMEDFDNLLAFFRAANPNVKVFCLANLAAFGTPTGAPRPGIYTSYAALEEKGVTVADWGYLVKSIIEGNTSVPGTTLSYTKNTFVVKDGYHPNPLTGYITSLVAYCAATGESAVGQPYSFYNNSSLSPSFDMTSYISQKYGSVSSNFMSVFASDADMKGIQSLIDKHLKERPFIGLVDDTPPTGATSLATRPTGSMITNVFSATKPDGNGWMPSSPRWRKCTVSGFQYYSGIRGDKDQVCSLEGTTVADTLTDAQKADLADIGYGISVIGLSHMLQTAYDTTTKAGGAATLTSLMNVVNGHYGGLHQGDLMFDKKLYNVNGEVVEENGYTALFTLNFGGVKTFEAIGYSNPRMEGIPTAQDVYVSDDGINWTKVEAACYATDTKLINISGSRDPWYNNKPAVEIMFPMNNVQGKYIRIGILDSNLKDADGYMGISVSEILVFGN